MQIYFFCLIFSTFFVYLANKSGSGRDIFWVFSSVALAIMTLVAGIRNEYVGTDTRAYTVALRKGGEFYDSLKTTSSEIGYFLLESAVRTVTDDYWVLLTLTALLVIVCFMWSIYNLSSHPAVSIFIFIAMGYYTFFFNGARQGIACAIYSLAFKPLIEGNFKKYFFWVLLAFCFHKTAIIALPLYFLFRQKHSLFFLLQIVVGASVVLLFFNSFLDLGALVSDRYSVYQTVESTGGRLLTLFYLTLSVFFIYYRSAIAASDRVVYDCFLNMLIFGSTIYIVITFSGRYVELTRLAIYFQIATVFLWPIVYKNIRTYSKYLFDAIFLVGHVVYFYIFINKMGGFVPYKFNEDLFQWLM